MEIRKRRTQCKENAYFSNFNLFINSGEGGKKFKFDMPLY